MPIINRDGNLHFYKVLHDSLLTQKDTVHPCTVILGFGTGVPHEIFDFVLQGYYTPFFSICQRKCENSLFSFFYENSLFHEYSVKNQFRGENSVERYGDLIFVKMHNFGLRYLSH
jgi:hypothetical protein